MKTSPSPVKLVSPLGLKIGREHLPSTKEVSLPVETITQTLGIVGQKGSGKSHLATVMVEEMLKSNLPVIVIDPMGVFYGLRSSVDGNQPRFPILILGGEFADVPITPGMGRSVAAWVVEERRQCILDLDGPGWRRENQCEFVADFAEELFALNRGQKHGKPLHLIVDEADIFAAQVPSGEAEKRSRDAIDEIVRRGRRRGLGMTMITQRPAVIAKDVLTQVSLLAILRLVGPQDRDAVMKWLEDGDEFQRGMVKKSLGGLQVGTAWLWSPGWLRSLRKVAVRGRTTFDSGRTPTVGEEPHGALTMATLKVGDVDFEEEEPEKDSKKDLKARIAEMESELRKLRSKTVRGSTSK